ncbi:MAG: TonB family protein [Polyangiales bacterium]
MRRLLVALACCSVVRLASAQELVPPKQLDHTPAVYPEGASGDAEVLLEIAIGANGDVESVKVIEGTAPFDRAAREAAAKWKFSPATRNGIPIRSRVRAKVSFSPSSPSPSPSPSTSTSTSLPALVSPPEKGTPEILEVREEREELGSTHIPRTETRFVPGAFADPFRVVETLPGVAPILSGLPYFFVRGAPPGDVGYYIDGIRVPILFHVGAGPSVIAPALVDRVDLFPSAYPTRFSRHVGGIMAGETTAPRREPHAEAQARIFDAGAMAEQPFDGGKGSALVGARYGYTGFIISKVAPDYSLGYWDYQARIAHTIGERDTLSVFAFGGYDHLSNVAAGRDLFDVQFHRVDLRWDRTSSEGRSRVAATFAYDHTLNAPDDAGPSGSTSTTRGLRLRAELDRRVGKGLRLRAGADVGFDRFSAEEQQIGQRVLGFGARTDAYGGAWIDLVARPSHLIEIVPGFHFDVFRARGETFLAPDPRLATRFRLGEGVALVSAFGVAHQLPTVTVPVPGRTLNGLEAAQQEAYQASESIEVALPSHMLAKVTAFVSRIRVPHFGVAARNYGGELFVRRDFSERFGGFLSYTLSRTERPGTYFGVSEFDRTHVLSLVLGYDLGRGFRIGTRAFFESGRPYVTQCPTPDCGPAPAPQTSFPYVQTGRLPAFFRIDVRFEKRWTFEHGRWFAATFEWFNATLSKEAEGLDWTPAGLRPDQRSALTLPSIGVEAGY